MADTKQQKIVTVIKTAVEQISVDNGFETDIGETVDDWRIDWDELECPAISICDLTAEAVEDGTNEYIDFYRLPIQIRIFLSSTTRAAIGRKYVAEVVKSLVELKDGFAVGEGAEREVLANRIELKRTGFELAEEGFRIAAAIVEIEVIFYTERFNLYQ